MLDREVLDVAFGRASSSGASSITTGTVAHAERGAPCVPGIRTLSAFPRRSRSMNSLRFFGRRVARRPGQILRRRPQRTDYRR
jgi:hypothetical protein